MTLRCILFSASFFLYSSLALSQNNWELKKEKDGIKIWVAETPNSSFKTFKAEFTIDANLETVKKILVDLDAITTYYEGISNVSDIKWINDNEAEYYLEFDFPWPVANRRAKVKSKAYPVEVGSYEISTNLIPTDLQKESFVPVKEMSSLWIIINAGKQKTFVKHIAHMDPSGKVPAWIANSKVVDTPFNSLKKLRKLVESKRL